MDLILHIEALISKLKEVNFVYWSLQLPNTYVFQNSVRLLSHKTENPDV